MQLALSALRNIQRRTVRLWATFKPEPSSTGLPRYPAFFIEHGGE